jgi:hypothetical protein|tara:strand:+ start:346 stop:714 length:369 start_codon:yes stop_codon:yes gene_type:complete
MNLTMLSTAALEFILLAPRLEWSFFCIDLPCTDLLCFRRWALAHYLEDQVGTVALIFNKEIVDSSLDVGPKVRGVFVVPLPDVVPTKRLTMHVLLILRRVRARTAFVPKTMARARVLPIKSC